MKTEQIQQTYEVAKARYADLGIDTEAALAALQKISLSLHCWQADDVTGFENQGGDLTGGIQATGNYPARPATSRSCAPTSSRPSRSSRANTA